MLLASIAKKLKLSYSLLRNSLPGAGVQIWTPDGYSDVGDITMMTFYEFQCYRSVTNTLSPSPINGSPTSPKYQYFRQRSKKYYQLISTEYAFRSLSHVQYCCLKIKIGFRFALDRYNPIHHVVRTREAIKLKFIFDYTKSKPK